MRILYVHERFGSLAGAEANVIITATEIARRSNRVGILHGPSTGRGVDTWNATFLDRYPLGPGCVETAVKAFRPDVIYVHKMADLNVIEALLATGVPLVRMVHDHDIYCMRSYKYDYLTRRICTRAAGPACIFPCLASVVRNTGPGLPLKLQSYSKKLREIAMNRRFDAGGIKDWLIDGHNGYLVPWMDTDVFAKRLDALLADKTLARALGKNGLQLVSERYNFDGYINGLERLFFKVSASKSTALLPL